MSDENCWLEKKQLIGPDCIGEEIHLMYIVQCYCKSINFVNTIFFYLIVIKFMSIGSK